MLKYPRSTLATVIAANVLALPAHAQLEEVVVTAQRRAENLQQVPIAVASFNNDLLVNSGVDSTIDLPQIAPSVQLVRSGPVAMFFMRGVGNTSGGTGEEGANAIYVDDVYVSDMKGSVLKFNNIERIEVLKGPQGTLFGRNSSGGLVNVITSEPGEEPVAKFEAGYSDYDTYSGKAYIAGPLSDTLSADIALTSSDQQEGWGEKFLQNQEAFAGWDWAARSKWVWEPSETMKYSLTGEYGKMSDDFTSTMLREKGAVGVADVVAVSDPYDSATTDQTYTDQTNSALTFKAEFFWDWATLTSITGYRDNDTETGLDIDTNAAPLVHIQIDSSTTTFQEELRLASNSDGRLSWQTGLFFLQSEAELSPQASSGLAFGGVDSGSAIYSSLDTTSYAVFGELSFALTDSTQLTGGVRYTEDERELDGRILPLGGGALIAASKGSKTDREPTFRLALRQDIGDALNVYASYNRGFKAGTYSMSAILSEPVEPQIIDAYELGLKSEWLDNTLRLNLAAFHYEIDDYQVRAVEGAAANAVLQNAAEVEIDGFEIELETSPMEGLNLFAYATFLDSEFASFPNAIFTYPNPAACNPAGNPPGQSSGAPAGGVLSCTGDAGGNKTPLAPEFAASIGGSYYLPLGGNSEMRLTALHSYNDGYYYEPDNRLEQPSFGLLNGSAEYRYGEHWSIEIWGRNLTDELYTVQKVGTALGDFRVPAAPRTYGINFKYQL